MELSKNKTAYVVLIGLFVLFKLAYTLTSTDDLIFLIKPTSSAIEFLTGSQAEYDSDFGYHFQALNFVIDKSCSGFNFWLLCFSMLSFLLLGYPKKRLQQWLVFPSTMLLAFAFTILANTSRIYTSIILEAKMGHLFKVSAHFAHEAIGVTTSLCFLMLIYFLTEKLINTNSYAKFW